MGRRTRTDEAKERAFSALKDAIVEEVFEKLPDVLTVRELQLAVGTSASYLRSSLISGRLTGTQVGERWELRKEENRAFITRRLRKRMKSQTAIPARAAPFATVTAVLRVPDAGDDLRCVCTACGATATHP